MPGWLLAGFWGLVAGAALLVGAALGYGVRINKRVIAAVMAFGSGVLSSTLSFDLVDEAYHRGGFDAVAFGFLGGAATYTALNVWLARAGANQRAPAAGAGVAAAGSVGEHFHLGKVTRFRQRARAGA